MHDGASPTSGTLAAAINTLARFCGPRDIPRLDAAGLAAAGLDRVDVLALFGGSILAGAEVFAAAERAGIARHHVIVGGRGHTTPALYDQVVDRVPSLAGVATEAELFDGYLRHVHGVSADLLERRSTNCGNNVTLCLDVLREHGFAHETMVVVQDACMQRRMDAGFRKHLSRTARVVNFASYQVDVVACNGELRFDHTPLGMWDMQRYISLLLGEVPRLTDDAAGYGPNGRGFIAHVDIPDQVSEAYQLIGKEFPELGRTADPHAAQALPSSDRAASAGSDRR